ncbi:unnamed protein product [Rangifer tarandus platyrhynchus]|uniref:Uncharacterized protein n=1 Tax=Rangifer tarandus platyrhynchus TaxID=3082113 RepID=A0AC59Z184_RANTA
MSRRAALGSDGPAAQTSQPRSKSQAMAERTDPAQTCSPSRGGASAANKHDFYQTSMRWRSVCNRRDGGSGAVRRRPGLRVFAFSAGFLRDRMNGAFLVLRPLLGRGGLGAPGQPVSREPPGADQAGRRCLGRDVEGNQRGCSWCSTPGLWAAL